MIDLRTRAEKIMDMQDILDNSEEIFGHKFEAKGDIAKVSDDELNRTLAAYEALPQVHRFFLIRRAKERTRKGKEDFLNELKAKSQQIFGAELEELKDVASLSDEVIDELSERFLKDERVLNALNGPSATASATANTGQTPAAQEQDSAEREQSIKIAETQIQTMIDMVADQLTFAFSRTEVNSLLSQYDRIIAMRDQFRSAFSLTDEELNRFTVNANTPAEIEAPSKIKKDSRRMLIEEEPSASDDEEGNNSWAAGF